MGISSESDNNEPNGWDQDVEQNHLYSSPPNWGTSAGHPLHLMDLTVHLNLRTLQTKCLSTLKIRGDIWEHIWDDWPSLQDAIVGTFPFIY